jgi:hypothetical protein
VLKISFEIWSWLNFFRFLDIRIFSWWRIWVAMVNMICCMDFIYIFMITYVKILTNVDPMPKWSNHLTNVVLCTIMFILTT